MRVLTVRQPWAWAIVHGGKDVENRVRNIAGDYRGPVAIHAGLSWDADEDGRVPMATNDVAEAILSKGHIVGVVDLVDAHKWPDCQTDVHQTCSEWAVESAWHLEFANPRPLAEPIPFRGALGLRTLTADVEAMVQERLR